MESSDSNTISHFSLSMEPTILVTHFLLFFFKFSLLHVELQLNISPFDLCEFRLPYLTVVYPLTYQYSYRELPVKKFIGSRVSQYKDLAFWNSQDFFLNH